MKKLTRWIKTLFGKRIRSIEIRIDGNLIYSTKDS